jgi:hypothetical protein
MSHIVKTGIETRFQPFNCQLLGVLVFMVIADHLQSICLDVVPLSPQQVLQFERPARWVAEPSSNMSQLRSSL